MEHTKVCEYYQTGDWKNEKHVPVIECPASVSADTPFDVTLSIGKEIAHPNTTEHHIRWIKLFFKPDNGKFAYEVGSFEFSVHGESVDGANEGPAFTEPYATARIKIKQPGTLLATSYCNIHGLWENEVTISIA
ncbi:MAG: class II SORL domain-containing protein [Thermodesulfobacteriota bacterium]|nr:class II SORL domain-containing protein [Thermodesulfobacteriota bacterium]